MDSGNKLKIIKYYIKLVIAKNENVVYDADIPTDINEVEK